MSDRTETPHVTIGALGHVDHGKTTLAAAIAAVQAEKGLAGSVGFDDVNEPDTVLELGVPLARTLVEYRTERFRYTHIDCPAHADHVKSLIAGSAAPLDGAVLVVSAVDGPLAQTRDHLVLLRQIGVPLAAVFLNKVDAVGEESVVRRVEEETRDLLSDCGYETDHVPVVRGSALRAWREPGNPSAARCIDELLRVLDEVVPYTGPRSKRAFLLPLESVYLDDEGRGLIGTGVVEAGTLHAGDRLERVGLLDTKEVTVSSVEANRRPVDRAGGGESVSLLVEGADRGELQRGMVLAAPGSLSAHTRFRAVAYFLTREEGGRKDAVPDSWEPRFQVRTAEVEGTLFLRADSRGPIELGNHAEVGVRLAVPVALERKQRFGIRETGRTVGAGVVTEVVQ